MSIASRIQEIETHIGDVYDTINYSYDTTGVNKNIINIPKYLKKGYIDIINNGIDTLYNNFPKVSGIGSNLSLTPTYEAPMKLNEIQGNTLQDSQPTPDSPVEIQSVTGLQNIEVCGKNLLDASQSFNGYINSSGGIGESNYDLLSDYIKVESGKNYTISLNTQFYNIGYAFYDSSKTYITRYNTNRNITTLTTTIPSGTSYIRVWFNLDGTTTLTPTNILQYEPMIEQGSKATTYEPYKGNTYEVNLGKNLFDINGTFTGNLIKYNNGFQLIKNSTNRTTNYFPSSPIPKGTYTLSYEIVSSTLSDITKCIAQAFNSSNTPIATKQFSNDGYVTFTTTGDITKIYFYISNTETDDTQITLDNIQLEKGTQSTSFSPYFTPIKLNKIGDYKDRIYKDNGKWYVEKQIGKVVLDGSETYETTGTNTSEKYKIRYDGVASLIKKPETANIIGDIISNQFITLSASDTYRCNQGISIEISGKISFYDETITQSTSAFTTWLASNNMTIYYVLNTPTYTEITNTELIEDLEILYTAKSQEGTTNISITSEDLEMILNVSALKGEV